MNRLELATDALEKGHELVILHENAKAPLHRAWQDRSPDAQETAWWIRKGKNYGIKARCLVVVDRDGSSRKVYQWTQRRRIHRSPMEVQTRRGWHLYFSLPEIEAEVTTKIHFLGLPVDLLTGSRFVVGPGSTVDGFTYELRKGTQIVGPGELPAFPVDILQAKREEVRAPVGEIILRPDERMRRYVEKIPESVQGQNGSTAFFVACLKILSLVGGNPELAWPWVQVYNRTRCRPPFDEEAEHGPDSARKKLRDAAERWSPR